MNKKVKKFIKKFNIPERTLGILGIIICVILLLSVASYKKLRTDAFALDNNIANENYNLLADKIAKEGYIVNMISNEDNTFSIIAKYSNDDIYCNIHFTVNNNGTIISNVIETSCIY